jgi:hypothetical protein
VVLLDGSFQFERVAEGEVSGSLGEIVTHWHPCIRSADSSPRAGGARQANCDDVMRISNRTMQSPWAPRLEASPEIAYADK